MINLYNGDKKAKSIEGIVVMNWRYRDNPIFKLNTSTMWFYAPSSGVKALIGQWIRVYSFNNFKPEPLKLDEVSEGFAQLVRNYGEEVPQTPAVSGCKIDGFIKFDEEGKPRKDARYIRDYRFEFKEQNFK